MRVLSFIFYIFFSISTIIAYSQNKKTPTKKKPATSTNKKKPATPEIDKKEQAKMQNRMDYDLYKTLENKVSTQFSDDLYPMLTPTLPNSLKLNPQEIDKALLTFKSSLKAKFEKSNSFITINGKPHPAPHHIVLSANTKPFPYRKDVNTNLTVSTVKSEKTNIKLLMEADDFVKENKQALLAPDSNFHYGINVQYEDGGLVPTSLTGNLKFIFPTKFFMADLKKTDVGKEFTLGDVKIKIVNFKPRTVTFEVQDPKNNLKWFMISDNGLQFSQVTNVNLTPKQYELYKGKKIYTDENIDSLVPQIDDRVSPIKVTHAKVFGKGNIVRVIFYTIEAVEPREIKLEISNIENTLLK